MTERGYSADLLTTSTGQLAINARGTRAEGAIAYSSTSLAKILLQAAPTTITERKNFGHTYRLRTKTQSGRSVFNTPYYRMTVTNTAA